jgi:hypothetical protein
MKVAKQKDFRQGCGQVSLEAAFAVIVAILLLLGTAYIFVWMNKCMVERQEQCRRTGFFNQYWWYPYRPKQLEIFKKN